MGININTTPHNILTIVPKIPGRFLPPNGLSIPMKPSKISRPPIACSAAAYAAVSFSLYFSKKLVALFLREE